MPFLTARMSKEEKEVMERILQKDREREDPPWKIHQAMVSFIEDLMHKSFSEGMIHNS